MRGAAAPPPCSCLRSVGSGELARGHHETQRELVVCVNEWKAEETEGDNKYTYYECFCNTNAIGGGDVNLYFIINY